MKRRLRDLPVRHDRRLSLGGIALEKPRGNLFTKMVHGLDCPVNRSVRLRRSPANYEGRSGASILGKILCLTSPATCWYWH